MVARGDRARGKGRGDRAIPSPTRLAPPCARASCHAQRIAALIDARSFDVETRIMPDWAALEAYLAATAGGLFALGGECLGSRGPSLEQAADSGRTGLWPDRADARFASACGERTRLSPGRCSPSSRDVARSGSCREDRATAFSPCWPSCAAKARQALRRSEPPCRSSSMPIRAPPSGRFAWLTLISLRLEKSRARSAARDRRDQSALPVLAHGALARIARGGDDGRAVDQILVAAPASRHQRRRRALSPRRR